MEDLTLFYEILGDFINFDVAFKLSVFAFAATELVKRGGAMLWEAMTLTRVDDPGVFYNVPFFGTGRKVNLLPFIAIFLGILGSLAGFHEGNALWQILINGITGGVLSVAGYRTVRGFTPQ